VIISGQERAGRTPTSDTSGDLPMSWRRPRWAVTLDAAVIGALAAFGGQATVGSRTVSVSLGGTTYRETGVDSPEDLVAEADAALYQAKESGRNRLVMLEARGAAA